MGQPIVLVGGGCRWSPGSQQGCTRSMLLGRSIAVMVGTGSGARSSHQLPEEQDEPHASKPRLSSSSLLVPCHWFDGCGCVCGCCESILVRVVIVHDCRRCGRVLVTARNEGRSNQSILLERRTRERESKRWVLCCWCFSQSGTTMTRETWLQYLLCQERVVSVDETIQ